MILAELIDETKFPPGVFNLINGDGFVTGEALTRHPDIDMISFTGSTRAGALISQNAASDFKRVSLELGGKGANIIFEDADPDAIVLKKVLNCDYNFIDSTWKDISPEAIDFIKSLMRPDPRHSVRFLAIISLI